jgi:hypothetical protein
MFGFNLVVVQFLRVLIVKVLFIGVVPAGRLLDLAW